MSNLNLKYRKGQSTGIDAFNQGSDGFEVTMGLYKPHIDSKDKDGQMPLSWRHGEVTHFAHGHSSNMDTGTGRLIRYRKAKDLRRKQRPLRGPEQGELGANFCHLGALTSEAETVLRAHRWEW